MPAGAVMTPTLPTTVVVEAPGWVDVVAPGTELVVVEVPVATFFDDPLPLVVK